MNPVTGGRSAPDVTVATADIAAVLSWTTEVGMGSDHLLVTTTIPVSPPETATQGKGPSSPEKGSLETLPHHLRPPGREMGGSTIHTQGNRSASPPSRHHHHPRSATDRPMRQQRKNKRPLLERGMQRGSQGQKRSRTTATNPNHADATTRCGPTGWRGNTPIESSEKTRRFFS